MKITDTDIIEVLKTAKVTDQSAMLELLIKKGFDITQASLSRRFKKLGITKVDGIYRLTKPENISINTKNIVLEIKSAPPNLIVVKTKPGFANSFAAELDDFVSKNKLADVTDAIVGTMAGDDTVFIAISDEEKIGKIIDLIKEL